MRTILCITNVKTNFCCNVWCFCISQQIGTIVFLKMIQGTFWRKRQYYSILNRTKSEVYLTNFTRIRWCIELNVTDISLTNSNINSLVLWNLFKTSSPGLLEDEVYHSRIPIWRSYTRMAKQRYNYNKLLLTSTNKTKHRHIHTSENRRLTIYNNKNTWLHWRHLLAERRRQTHIHSHYMHKIFLYS